MTWLVWWRRGLWWKCDASTRSNRYGF